MGLEDFTEECWECNFSEYPIKASQKVSLHSPLSNGLTPYELMYGMTDSDTRHSNNLENYHCMN